MITKEEILEKLFPIYGRQITNEDLISIIQYAPKKYKEKAWEKLLEQNPSNQDLCLIVGMYSSSEIRIEAKKKLLEQNPTNEDLICIIKNCSEEYGEKAVAKLLEQNPTSEDLQLIIQYVSTEYKEKAWKLLSTKTLIEMLKKL